MPRVCFLLQVRPDRVADYVRAHEAVWPDMKEALHDTGWRNYSLFIRAGDGLVFGYLETQDFDTALAGMAGREVNQRWQAATQPFFALHDSRPD